MENEKHHVCPWWLGYFLINPIRRYGQNPAEILSPYIKPGMQVLDYGCAMGYFSIPMAKMTGSKGRIFCIDIQQRMLNKLVKRAKNAGVEDIIKPRIVGGDYNVDELKGRIDFALLFAVVHEVPEKSKLFREITIALIPGGKVLFAEPAGRVTAAEFENSKAIAEEAGLIITDKVKIYRSQAIVLEKNK
jgi:2-polyprenyl-3-methyl-5-hydroxy-6-metoxy-1,4-benzoquinol methylase